MVPVILGGRDTPHGAGTAPGRAPLTRHPLPADLPVLEERAWGGQALEGHDRTAPAACGPVAPAEGLRRPEEAQGPGDRAPIMPAPLYAQRPAWPPAAGEGRTLPARPGSGPRDHLGPVSRKNQPPPPPGQFWGRGCGSHFPALPLYLPDLLILKKWGRSREPDGQTGRSLQRPARWAPSPVFFEAVPGVERGPGEGRPRCWAPASPRQFQVPAGP